MEHALFSAIVLFICSLSVFLQFYVIFVIVTQSPESMATYRYFLCLISIWDLTFSSLLGYGFHPKFLPLLPAAKINGLFKYLGFQGGVIGMSIIHFAAVNVIAAQVYSLLYRFVIVLQNARIHEHFMSPVGILIVQVASLGISVVYSVVAYQGLISTKEATTQYVEELSVFFNLTSPSREEIVIAADLRPGKVANSQISYAIAVIVGMAFVEILCIVLAIVIIKMLRKSAHVYSKKTYKIQLQLTLLLIIQLLSPIIFFVVPIVYPIINGLALHGTSESTGDLIIIFMSLYALSNSLLTITFVTPYRRYTLSKFTVCCGKRFQKATVPAEPSTQLSRQRIARITSVNSFMSPR